MNTADVADLTERLQRADARREEYERNTPVAIRDAVKVLSPLIRDLPTTEEYLLNAGSLRHWRVLRDEDPDAYLIYVSHIRTKCGNGVSQLVLNSVGPPKPAVVNHGPIAGYTLSAIWEDYEPPRYLAKRLLSPSAVTVLFGQSGHLKSATAIDISLCIGDGKPFHGLKTRKAAVLYVAGEGHAGIKKRMRAWLISRGITSADEQPLVYVTSAGADLIGNPDQLKATVEHAGAVLGAKIELIVIDTLAACFGAGDENHSRDMSLAITNARNADTDAAVLLVHHTGHGQVERERGSYALIAAADYRIQATYDEFSKLLELRWHKCKDDEKPEPMTFECRRVSLEWEDEDGEELTSVVLERLEGASIPTNTPRSVGLGKNQEIALKSLKTLYAKARKNLEEQGRDPTEACILVDGWRNELGRRGIKRQRFHDVLKDLQERRLIVVDGPHVKLTEASL